MLTEQPNNILMEAILQKLHFVGLLPTTLIINGKKQRCPTTARPQHNDGEYHVHLNKDPILFWRNYYTGQKGKIALSTIIDINKQIPKELKVLTLKEFVNLPIPIRSFLLYPIISEQSIALLYALRGLGKTYVALSIGLTVAGGKSLFNWQAEKPYKVMYIDGEMPANTMQERMRRLTELLKIELEYQDNFLLITPDLQEKSMPNLATTEGQAEIEPFLSGVALIIIDNLATLCRAGRENDAESWLPVQGWLLDLRRRGISVLLVHHAGKNGDQRGTSAKEDIMDTVITLRRPKNYKTDEGARFEVHLTKARNLCGDEAAPFEAQLCNENDGLYWLVKDLEESEMVGNLLNAGKSIREIADELEIPKTTVHRIKQKLEAKKDK